MFSTVSAVNVRSRCLDFILNRIPFSKKFCKGWANETDWKSLSQETQAILSMFPTLSHVRRYFNISIKGRPAAARAITFILLHSRYNMTDMTPFSPYVSFFHFLRDITSRLPLIADGFVYVSANVTRRRSSSPCGIEKGRSDDGQGEEYEESGISVLSRCRWNKWIRSVTVVNSRYRDTIRTLSHERGYEDRWHPSRCEVCPVSSRTRVLSSHIII